MLMNFDSATERTREVSYSDCKVGTESFGLLSRLAAFDKCLCPLAGRLCGPSKDHKEITTDVLQEEIVLGGRHRYRYRS